ncbi:unnamed protein product [Rotaria sp. Silwood1]|nr:unnamed protein product [Rotaria sp. Silwood1]
MIISQLVHLLKPFKQVLVIIQKGKTPSLHLVTIVILTLRRSLESYSSLIEYNKNYEIDQSSEDLSENEDEYVEEEGNYLNVPYMKCDSMANNVTLNEPVKKKPKRFGEDFETRNLSDEFDNECDDELNKYLEQRIDTESIDDNPLSFWYHHRLTYPILSQLARSIYSIPASTANVERTFSGSGMMINSRRTRLNPEQINNAMFLRSVKKMSDCIIIVFHFHIFIFFSISK